MITAKTKIARDASLRITRKNFIINWEPRCSLYDKCHIKMEYDMNYKFICDYCKNKNCLRHEIKNHKKNFITNLEPRWSLYDKGHIKTEYDMNYKFICDYCKNKSHSRCEFKNHKKNFIINSEPKVFTVWQMSQFNGVLHELEVHMWPLRKRKLLKIRV